MNESAVRRGRVSLLILVVVFALPVVAAWFFYFNPQYLPEAKTNRGQLLNPQVDLGRKLGLHRGDGSTPDWDAMNGHWTLVSLERAPCADACRHRLADMRQIRLALGGDAAVVERLLVLAADSLPPGLAGDFPGLRIALAPASTVARLSAALSQGGDALGRIYIRDPMGHLMMRYASDAPAKDTLKDMEHLLKASKNWIKR